MKKLVCTFLLLFWVTQIAGQTINYQGRLTNTNGDPVNETVNISLKIYDSETGGSVLYSEEVGEVDVVNGLYSFKFGETGKSLVELSEIIAVTTSEQKVYNFDTKYKPLIGEVTITDGSKTWSSVTGGLGNNLLIGSVNAGLGNVSGIYTTDAPASDLLLKVTYFCEFGGINRTLNNLGKKYLAISIDGSPLSQRELVTGAPYAHKAGSVINLFKSISPLNLEEEIFHLAEENLIIFGEISQNVARAPRPQEVVVKVYNTNHVEVRDHSYSTDRFGTWSGDGSRQTFVFAPISAGEFFKLTIKNVNANLFVIYF